MLAPQHEGNASTAGRRGRAEINWDHEAVAAPGPAPDPGTDRRRAFRFLRRVAIGSATEVVPLRGGVAVLNSRFPYSQAHNHLIVEHRRDAAELLGDAERVLGGAGLDSRCIEVEGDVPSPAWLDPFRSAGYAVSQALLMRPVRSSERAPTVSVEEASYADLLEVVAASWRRSLPGASDDVVAQLVGREEATAAACSLSHLVVRLGGRVVSRADLRRIETEAEIDAVETEPEFRGRGYATAVVLEALARARESGCDLVFLLADRGDWPQQLYRRLGFEEFGIQTTLSRLIAGA